MPQPPADRPGKSPNADHEADNPGCIGRGHQRAFTHLRKIRVLSTPRHQQPTDYISDHGKDYPEYNTGDNIGVVQKTTGLAMLLWLRHSLLLMNNGGHGHAVLFPPISRTHESNCSWVTTWICVSM